VGCDWPVSAMDIGHIPFGLCVVNTHDYVDCHANYASALFAALCAAGCVYLIVHVCFPRKFGHMIHVIVLILNC
jgi:hypothetical protein